MASDHAACEPEATPSRLLVLVTTNNGDGTASVRLGDGEGGFDGGADVPVGAEPYSVALGSLLVASIPVLTPAGLPDLGPQVPVPADPLF